MTLHNKPKKSLGQHFLLDENIAQKMVNFLEFDHATPILEIGAGKGILTKYLLKKTNNLWISEIDKNQIYFLKKNVKNLDENKIILGDALKINFQEYFTSSIAIIGNLPYYISSPLLFKILENKHIVNQVVCMLQQEVAKRICSKSGTKVYGILSVLLQAYYKVEYLFKVDKKVFYPMPKITSAVIRLTKIKNSLECNEKLFFNVVKTSFNQRRKTIKNSLKPILGNNNFNHPFNQKRPEQLSVQDFISLVNYLEIILKN